MRSTRPTRTSAALLTAFGALAATAAVAPHSAVAQSIDLASLEEIDDDRTDITHENLTIDDIEDMDVVRNGEVIGEVEGVLGNAAGEVVALVIEHGGGALGLGDREVVVEIDDVEFPAGRDEVEITLTDDELAALPVWED